MSWFESFILGLVQGLTEFLPISSSAHLRLTAAFAGWQDPGAAFTAITQIGTEAAVLIYFRKDIARIVSAWFRSLTNKEMRGDHDAQMGWLVIVGSIPIGVLGVTFKDQIEGPFRDLRLIATTLIVMGIVLGIADRLAARDEEGGKHRASQQRKTLAGAERQGRPDLRCLPGDGADSRCLPLGRHHQRRSAAWATPVRRRPATRSCSPSRPCWPPASSS